MPKVIASILGVLLLMSAKADEPKGIIGRMYIDGFPVIYKFVNEFPAEEIRLQYPRLVVVSWQYDGSENNGMPKESVNKEMIELEDTLEEGIENQGICKHVYSRTGNNLKELVYQIRSDETFLESLNKSLAGHPRYPIEITFYEDKEWQDFKELLNDFNKGS